MRPLGIDPGPGGVLAPPPSPGSCPDEGLEAGEGGWPGWFSTPRHRAAVYAFLLALVAMTTMFYRLGADTLIGDEAAFASTTDRMLATGDWVVPHIGEDIHLNATPLYNWLTMATRPWFDEGPLWHRFWSSAFGVGCVLLTFALAAALFGPEMGLLAGLFLALNRDFLCCHGARFGGMDSMTAFFLTAAVCCYASLLGRAIRPWLAWAGVGACIGLAWLSKPPAFGCFFLAVITLHHLWARRREPLAGRAGGPLLALALGVVIASWWYLLIWLRVGNAALHQLFVFNSVERALDAQGRDFRCCHKSFWHASVSFKLMEVALAAALACWALSARRRQWGLVVFVAGSFLAALTAAGKAGNYIYYAYPLLCIVLAGLFLECGPRLATWWSSCPAARARATVAGAALAVLALGADAGRLALTLSAPAWVHPPLRVYNRLPPEPAAQSCRFVMFDFPGRHRKAPPTGTRLNFEDIYYGPRMAQALWVDTFDELKRLLQDRQPTVVILPPIEAPTPATPALGGLGPEGRAELGMWQHSTYPVLTFHGATALLQAGDLIPPAR